MKLNVKDNLIILYSNLKSKKKKKFKTIDSISEFQKNNLIVIKLAFRKFLIAK